MCIRDSQIAALPLGGRVKVDPWSAKISLMKNNRVALLSAREKMPFQITPLMPHLIRHQSADTAVTTNQVNDETAAPLKADAR